MPRQSPEDDDVARQLHLYLEDRSLREADAQDLLRDELDAPLEPAERPGVMHHLVHCEPCRAFAAPQRQLDAELRDGVPALVLEAGVP